MHSKESQHPSWACKEKAGLREEGGWSEEGSQQSRNAHAPLPRVGDPFLSSQIQRLLGGHISNVAEVLYMHLKETDICCLAS